MKVLCFLTFALIAVHFASSQNLLRGDSSEESFENEVNGRYDDLEKFDYPSYPSYYQAHKRERKEQKFGMGLGNSKFGAKAGDFYGQNFGKAFDYSYHKRQR